MRRLLTDSATNRGDSNRAKDLLRALLVGAWQSEPDQQTQNPAERRIEGESGRIEIRPYFLFLCRPVSQLMVPYLGLASTSSSDGAG